MLGSREQPARNRLVKPSTSNNRRKGTLIIFSESAFAEGNAAAFLATSSTRDEMIYLRRYLVGERKQSLLRLITALAAYQWSSQPNHRAVASIHADRIGHQVKFG